MAMYPRYSVVISKEEESRKESGRAPRMPPADGPVRKSARTGASEQVDLEEFWEEVVSGRLGLPPLPVKTSALVSEDRCNAALLEGQLVTLSPSDLVG